MCCLLKQQIYFHTSFYTIDVVHFIALFNEHYFLFIISGLLTNAIKGLLKQPEAFAIFNCLEQLCLKLIRHLISLSCQLFPALPDGWRKRDCPELVELFHALFSKGLCRE